MSNISSFIEYEVEMREFVTRLERFVFPDNFNDDIDEIILDVQTLKLQLGLLDDGKCRPSPEEVNILLKRLASCRTAFEKLLGNVNAGSHLDKVVDYISKAERSVIRASQTCSIITQANRRAQKMVMYNSLQSSGHARVHAGDVHGNVTYYINPDPSVEQAREPWPRSTRFLFIMPSLISLSHICIVYTQIVRGSWDITIRLRNVVPAASRPDLTATQQNPDCWRMLEALDRLSTHDFSANGNGLIWDSVHANEPGCEPLAERQDYEQMLLRCAPIPVDSGFRKGYIDLEKKLSTQQSAYRPLESEVNVRSPAQYQFWDWCSTFRAAKRMATIHNGLVGPYSSKFSLAHQVKYGFNICPFPQTSTSMKPHTTIRILIIGASHSHKDFSRLFKSVCETVLRFVSECAQRSAKDGRRGHALSRALHSLIVSSLDLDMRLKIRPTCRIRRLPPGEILSPTLSRAHRQQSTTWPQATLRSYSACLGIPCPPRHLLYVGYLNMATPPSALPTSGADVTQQLLCNRGSNTATVSRMISDGKRHGRLEKHLLDLSCRIHINLPDIDTDATPQCLHVNAMNDAADFAVAAQFLNTIVDNNNGSREDPKSRKDDASENALDLQAAVSSTSTYDDIQARDNASIQNGDIIAQTITHNYFYGTILLHDPHTNGQLAQAEIAIRHICINQHDPENTVSTQKESSEPTPTLRAHQERSRDRDALSWHLAEIFYIVTKSWVKDPLEEYLIFMTNLDAIATTAVPTLSMPTANTSLLLAYQSHRPRVRSKYWARYKPARTETDRSARVSDSDDNLELPEPMTRHQPNENAYGDEQSSTSVTIPTYLHSPAANDTWTGISCASFHKGPYANVEPPASFPRAVVQLSHTETRTTILRVPLHPQVGAGSGAEAHAELRAQPTSGWVEEIEDEPEQKKRRFIRTVWS